MPYEQSGACTERAEMAPRKPTRALRAVLCTVGILAIGVLEEPGRVMSNMAISEVVLPV